ncbi:hypothetical protein IW146_003677 [Coemansia sp. RSA 922]|nr:hypothetical protein IW146_003677 [Coemansia sp. RSA 922]
MTTSGDPGATQGQVSILHSDILRLVFAYLSPKPRSDCTGTQLLKHLKRFHKVAGVNRQWREVAMPLFYQVAAVVFIELHFDIDRLGDQYDDDDEEDDEWSEDNDDSGDEYSDEDNEGYSDENSDNYTDVDSYNDDYGTKVLSNIRLIHGAGQVNMVREMRIAMQGKGQKIRDLMRMLNNAGLGEYVWPNVERLQFDMLRCTSGFMEMTIGGRQPKGMKVFNKLLSRALPSLREISFRGDGAYEQYNCIPIERLIIERLGGPKPLRALKIESDSALCLDDYEDLEEPVTLERLCINCEDMSGNMGMPTVLASSLVELSYTVASVNHIWDDFEVDAVGGSSHLEFSRLRSLNLIMEKEHSLVDHMHSLGLESQESHNYLRSEKYGKPHFPVLTSLDIRNFPKDYGRFLSLFADSPISKLMICGRKKRIPNDLNLSRFRGLRSLSILFIDLGWRGNPGNVDANLSSVFATTNSGLQHLTLVTTSSGLIGSRISAPAFAHSLVTLTLGGEINLREVELLLQLCPNLQKLRVSAHTCPQLSSPLLVVEEYRRINTPQPPAPLSRSLRVLQAEHIKYFIHVPNWSGTGEIYLNKAHVESVYRGLLLNLACRLPSLDTLLVNGKFIDIVEICISALVESGTAPGHLQRLRILSLDY